MERKFNKGDIVQHFKREKMTAEQLKEEPNLYLYEIIGTARHTEDKEELMRLLISHPTSAEYSIYNTTWEALIAVFNRVVKPQDKLPLELPIPDYTKIII